MSGKWSLKIVVDSATRRQWRAFDNDALQVLCRVFDDGADAAYEEWLAWRKPEQWMHPSRALGAFIRIRLNRALCSRCLAKERSNDRRRALNRAHSLRPSKPVAQIIFVR